MRQNLTTSIKEYIAIFKDESASLGLLQEQIERETYDDVTHRKNFVGHITASAFVLTPEKKVLLLQHKSLNRLLQPGGHVEPGDVSLLDAALREVQEETGLQSQQLTIRSLLPGNDLLPFHISSHHIPENIAKHEAAHYHHDFQYLAIVKNEHAIHIDNAESTAWQWLEWDEFKKLDTFRLQAPKIEHLLAKSPEHFFETVLDGQARKDISLLIVAHVIPSSIALLRFLKHNFNLIGVIPKPKSIDKNVYNQLSAEGIQFIQVERNAIDINFMTKILDNFTHVVLVDIGGYFSAIASGQHGLKNILGIIEDTENGYQKYEDSSTDLAAPVCSVARSPLKDNEDYLVGHSIAHATDTLLRQINILTAFSKCGVIGYGKVGQGVCDYLNSLHAQPTVCDINAERLVRAYNHGNLVTTDLDHLLATNDVIFCATGSRALDIHKFRKIKNGAYLASVTSSDDEFNLDYLASEYKIVKKDGYITHVSNGINWFYLLNDGNAVNFLYNASVGEFIYLVQAEICRAIIDIANKKGKIKQKTIYTLDELVRQEIASLWIKEFIK